MRLTLHLSWWILAAGAPDVGPRTSEKVSLAKKVAGEIACGVCQVVIGGIYANLRGGDEVSDSFDVNQVCTMRSLARTMKGGQWEVVEHGSKHVLQRSAASVFYEEINESDLVFHWQSMAVREACYKVMRREVDIVETAEEMKANEEEDGRGICKKVKICGKSSVGALELNAEL
mmetsp:Transcript_2921/g.6626  ORF Transcript_2921/g.6626 Transcript_2921/m.6626 type:complete len:174 (+) Transcript_2921:17-538(+)